MDQDSLRDYRRGLDSVLLLLLKAHKELQFLAAIPSRIDFDIRGEQMAKSSDFTTLLEKATTGVVNAGRELNAHRGDVDQLLRTAAEFDTEASNAQG